jgi:hypothetical protein
MSFLFGSGKGLPAIDQRPFGLQTVRANTNQQARPVPLLYGQQRIGVTFISDVFDLLATPVTQSIGKQASQVGNNYFASFAALCCIGPVDGLVDIFLNGEPVFASTTSLLSISLTAAGTPGALFYTATFQTANPHGLATGEVLIVLGADQPEFNGEFTITVVSATQFQYQIVPTGVRTATANQSGAITAQVRLNPVLRDPINNPDGALITIPDYGTMQIYWGTETQPADAYLNAKSGVAHPAYLGLCYVVFHQLFFGFNQTNVPNIEIVLTRSPQPSWGNQKATIQLDANPAYVIADLYQGQRSGLALPDAAIDTAALETAAAGFVNETLGVSMPINRSQDLRSILMGLCETIDALPGLDANGLLSLIPIRPPGAAILPAIGDSDLADLPQFTPQDWTTTYSATWAQFSNRDLAYQDDAREWRDTGTLNVIRNPDALTLDRRWITRADLAQTIANVAGQAAAIPMLQGKILLRYNDALFASLAPGSMFTINSATRDTSHLVFRVMSRSVGAPDKPEFEVQFQADRTYLYTALIAGAGAGQQQSLPRVPDLAPLPGANTRLRLVELPPALCPGQPAIAALVARDSTAITNFALWLKRNFAWSGAPPDSYSLVQTPTRFALHGITQSDYPAATRLIDLELGVIVQLDGPDVILDAVSAFDALANTMLGFLDDEILSLAGWTLLGPGLYQLQFVRGRFGTPIEFHPAGTQILMVGQGDLPVITQPAFRADNTATVKIPLGRKSVSDVASLNLTLAGTAWRVPPPCALSVNGRSFNPVFPGGVTPLTISWVLPDAGGLLPRFDLVKLYTRLQLYIGAAADSGGITVDNTLITSDGGTIALGDEQLIYQVDVAWPATSLNLVFHTVSGAVDQNFLIVAQTIADMGWNRVPSATVSTLNALKFP